LSWQLTNLDELVVEHQGPNEVLVHGRGLVERGAAFVELKGGEKTYCGNYTPAPIAPLDMAGDWTVTVDSPTISQPHADVKDDPEDAGLRARWFEESHTSPWDRLWLSPMNCSIRKWNLIGPFANFDDQGLEQVFPPERGGDFQAVYEGDGGRQIGWLTVDMDDPRIAPELAEGWDWAVAPNAGGRYAPDSYVVDYGRVLKLGRWPAGTVFAQTYVFVPEAQDAIIVLATPCPSAVWCNGRQVHSRWVRPAYNELKDGFAHRVPMRLDAGWNSLLLKFLHNQARPTRAAFTCRLVTVEGEHLRSLAAATRPVAADMMQPRKGFLWLRLAVPVFARAIRLPSFDGPWSAFVDGNPVASTAEVPLPKGSRYLVLRVGANEVLDRQFEFVAAPAVIPFGTWSMPGMEHFSGTMTYEKTVDVPDALLKARVLFDCGQVGVSAEAWVNDKHVGIRPWPPYAFDVTDYLRAGRNRFKVRVANTEANARAVGDSAEILKNIDLNGWLGPAWLVPYLERQIRCVPDSR
jgi:hypothetical protein